MKKIATYIYVIGISLTLLVLHSCSGNYDIEDESYQCYKEITQDHNVDLDSAISAIETHMVSEGKLNGTSGQDYVDFLEQIMDERRIPVSAYDPSNVELIKLTAIPFILHCKSRFEHPSYSGSKAEKLDLNMNYLAISSTISPNGFAEVFLKSLETKDFEHNYYKALFWQLYGDLFVYGPDISALLPLKETSTDENIVFDGPMATIELTEDDLCLWNGNSIDKDQLHDSVYYLVSSSMTNSKIVKEFEKLGSVKVSHYKIELNTTPLTGYGFYIETQNILIGCLNEIRTEYAQEYYQTDFFELNEDETKVIKSIVRDNIIEQ